MSQASSQVFLNHSYSSYCSPCFYPCLSTSILSLSKSINPEYYVKKWIGLWHSFAQKLKWLSSILGVKSKHLPLIYSAFHGLAPTCLSRHISSHPSASLSALPFCWDPGCPIDRILALVSLHKLFYFSECSTPTYLPVALTTVQYNVFFFFPFNFWFCFTYSSWKELYFKKWFSAQLQIKHKTYACTHILIYYSWPTKLISFLANL